MVMAGVDACPKDKIFTHLSKTIDNGTKLSYRIYERLLDDKPVLDIPETAG
jgi:hypothetical protein